MASHLSTDSQLCRAVLLSDCLNVCLFVPLLFVPLTHCLTLSQSLHWLSQGLQSPESISTIGLPISIRLNASMFRTPITRHSNFASNISGAIPEGACEPPALIHKLGIDTCLCKTVLHYTAHVHWLHNYTALLNVLVATAQLYCTTIDVVALYCTTIDVVALYCTTIDVVALHCTTALHYSMWLHNCTTQCTGCTALYCTT